MCLALGLALGSGQPVMADPHPMGLGAHRFNGSAAPATERGITTFKIRNHECSTQTYGDGRGEHDCVNGNVRSTLSAFVVSVGETRTYAFDFRIGAPLTYRGWNNSHASGFLNGSDDSRLRFAGWQGNRLHNFMYMLKLDSRRGVYFLNETCVEPEEMHDWHSFRMEVHWAADTRGWIRVSCDDKVIHFAEGIATTIGPHCYITNLCRDASAKNPSRVLVTVGPVMQGFGPEWKSRGKQSPFTDFEGEITVQMRNVAFTQGAKLYDAAATEAVRGLQQHLTDLGCDPGPVDGVMGARTRTAAQTCRALAAADLPDAINAGTVAGWLAAYRAEHPG